MSTLICFACIFGSFYATYKLNVELVEIQNHLTALNKKLVLLSEKCESLNNEDNILMSRLVQESNDTVENFTTEDSKTLEDMDIEYDYESEESMDKVSTRLRRANHRNKQGNRRFVKSSGIFILLYQ